MNPDGLSDKYIPPSSFDELLGRRREKVQEEQALLAKQMAEAQAQVSAPGGTTREQNVNAALLGILPALLGLAIKGKKGLGKGGLVGAKGVADYIGRIEKDDEEARRVAADNLKVISEQIKSSGSIAKELEKQELKHASDLELLPMKTQYAKELAGYKEAIKPNTDLLGGDWESWKGGVADDSTTTGAVPQEGTNLPVVDISPVVLPDVKEFGRLEALGREKIRPDFVLADASITEVKKLYEVRYETIKQKFGEEAAQEYDPQVTFNSLRQLVSSVRDTVANNMPEASMPTQLRIASDPDWIRRGGMELGLPPPKTFSQAMQYARFALELARARGETKRPISETMAAQMAVNLSLQSDIQAMIDLVDKFDDTQPAQGLMAKAGEGILSLLDSPNPQERRAAIERGAASGALFERIFKDSFTSAIGELAYANAGRPEFTYVKMGNLLATKYASLYNGKRLSDMDFRIFKALVAVDSINFASKKELRDHLTYILNDAQNNFETQHKIWKGAGWNAPPLSVPAQRESNIAEMNMILKERRLPIDVRV